MNSISIPFEIRDVLGNITTNTFTTSLYPVTFSIPNINSLGDIFLEGRVLWNFGDGSTSTDFNPTHIYDEAGEYNIILSIFDINGNQYDNTDTQKLKISHIISDTISSNIPSNRVTVKASHYSSPIVVTSTLSPQHGHISVHSISSDISFTSNGQESHITSEYYNLKYSHLRRWIGFTNIKTHGDITEYIYSRNSESNTTLYYAKRSNTNVVLCESTDEGAVFIGTKADHTVAFRCDDIDAFYIANSPTIRQGRGYFKFDNNMYGGANKLVNMIPHTFNITVNPPYSPGELSNAEFLTTTNGINSVDNLSIENGKDIPIFIQPAISGSALKMYDNADIQVTSIELFEDAARAQPYIKRNAEGRPLGVSGNITTEALAEKAYIATPNILTTTPDDSITVGYSRFLLKVSDNNLKSKKIYGRISGTINSYDNTWDILNAPTSNVPPTQVAVPHKDFILNVIPNNVKIIKVGENFDTEQSFKDNTFQDILRNSDTFFNMIGSMLGNIESDPMSVGTHIYERIKNIVSNTNDPDTSTLASLQSILDSVDVDFKYINSLGSVPPNLRRTLDILSIKYTKLRGNVNQYNRNFEDKGSSRRLNITQSITDDGFSGYDAPGLNLGRQICLPELNTYEITQGLPLVARERFSGKSHMINMNIIDGSFINAGKFKFTDYDHNIFSSWELVLPSGGNNNYNDIIKYYDFYEYIETPQLTQLDGIINWSDERNTHTFRDINNIGEWNGENGFVEHLIHLDLSRSLNI